MEAKIKCKSCLIEKELVEYHKDKYSKSGYTSKCKKCRLDYNRQWRMENKLYLNNIARKNYYKNQDKRIEYSRVYRIKNLDSIKRYSKSYLKKYNQRDYVKIKYRISGSGRRKIKKETSDGTINLKSLENLLIQQDYKCIYCGCSIKGIIDNNGNDGKHLDHIHPLSKGGKHILTNVQWTCWKCNLSKGVKII